jgi:hypothetical protein
MILIPSKPYQGGGRATLSVKLQGRYKIVGHNRMYADSSSPGEIKAESDCTEVQYLKYSMAFNPFVQTVMK